MKARKKSRIARESEREREGDREGGWMASGVYLGIEIGSLLHERADRKPETIGQREIVAAVRRGGRVRRR